ncbi:CEL4a mannanase [Panaeolus papilionaceus]|nr:CEL4a mannanase [Panaeolus papilionaceus]
MTKIATGLVTLALSLHAANAAVPMYGQCGGIGYTGETTCVSGAVCVKSNDYYSQCVPGTTSAPTMTTTRTTTTRSTTTPTSTPSPPTSTGFVKTSGTRFVLNGSKYTVVGTNSYWVGLAGLSSTDINKAFADMAAAGATTVRTWGFNEVTSANGIYYQLWNGAKPTINTGSNGLGSFDKIVAAAKANGLRLIVALTNNWADFGGMDVYVKQILGSNNHDLFYTDSNVKNAFKNYIKTFVGRYANEPTIMAWELCNEPRCKGSSGTSTGTCTTSTITSWAKEISAYIKSVDSNHLVALGDEGFFNQPNGPNYPYQGGEGVDFDANLQISTLDFGTFHAYPEPWGQSANPQAWGLQWIADHATSMKKANKPVIIEEFGATSNQATVYTAWWNQIVSSGLTGDLIWQAGSHLSNGDTWNDGYAVYPDGPVYPIMKAHAATLKARA